MIKLVLMDFDQTLVNEDILDILCEINNKKDISRKLNQDFINGKKDGFYTLKTRIDFLKGISLVQIKNKLEKKTYLTSGAKELFVYLNNNSIKSILHSGNITPVLNYYKNILNITNIIGTNPIINQDIIQGINIEDIGDKNFKYNGVKKIIDNLKLKKEEILAVGDSPADLKVFELASIKVAINPKGNIEKQVDYVVKDLFQIIDIIRRYNEK